MPMSITPKQHARKCYKNRNTATLHNQLGTVVLGRLAVGAHLRLQLALGEAVKREGVGGNRVGNELRVIISNCTSVPKRVSGSSPWC